MITMQLEENPVDVINAILAAEIVHPERAVNAAVVLDYLSEWSSIPEGIDRVNHFQRWLDGDLALDY